MQDKPANTLRKGLAAAALSALIAAVVFAAFGYLVSYAHPLTEDPNGNHPLALATPPYRLYLPAVSIPDEQAPTLDVELLLNGFPTSAYGQHGNYEISHDHELPVGYYALRILASDPSGIVQGGIGWDLNGDGYINVHNQEYQLDAASPYTLEPLQLYAIAIDMHLNVAALPVTVTFTNQPPGQPQIIGSLTCELGTQSDLKLQATDPNHDPLIFTSLGDPITGTTFYTRTGEMHIEAWMANMGSHEISFRADEEPHQHGPPYSSQPISATLTITDTTPPESINDLWIISEYPEQVRVGLHSPVDNDGFGRIADIILALAERPILDADWQTLPSDVQFLSLKELKGYTTPYIPQVMSVYSCKKKAA